jgi:hypothetical protein
LKDTRILQTFPAVVEKFEPFSRKTLQIKKNGKFLNISERKYKKIIVNNQSKGFFELIKLDGKNSLKMEEIKRFSNLNPLVRSIIFTVNALLILVFFVISFYVIILGLWGSLYALGSLHNGGALFLAIFFLVLFWLLCSFVCFTLVITSALVKKRWNWIAQFLPFLTGGLFYLALIIASRLFSKPN